MSPSRFRAVTLRFDPEIAAIRIGLFVVAPALMWAAILRVAGVI